MRSVISKEFDERFYLEAYPWVKRADVGPVQHFIVSGWREDKDPNENFSTRAYRETYADVAKSGENPFYHYLTKGRAEGRVAQVSVARRKIAREPTTALRVPPAPQPEEWAAMPKRRIPLGSAHAVTVIIPVYRSLEHVAATLSSVLCADCETAYEVVVVDDCSPEPEVSGLLDQLAQSGHIRLIRNETNQGFVRSCNRAMREDNGRDVVLLNADTIVYDRWLDRLAAPTLAEPDVATVTPLSNNATLASYPNTGQDNSFEMELRSVQLDRLCFRANGHHTVEVPTGVGFCLYIRRAALRSLGLFDDRTFGLGYGEETDFCMRALKSGWRNVLATGVYVRHFGSMSFGTTVSERQREAGLRMTRKHPDYEGRVRRYFAADPSLEARMRIDVARVAYWTGGVAVLFITHTRGGGVQTFLDNAREALIRDGLDAVVDRSVVIEVDAKGQLIWGPFGSQKLPYVPNLSRVQINRHANCLKDLFRILNPELIHVNSFAGMDQATTENLMAAIQGSGRPYWHIWHDHQPLCPRLNFLDAEDKYCGETNVELCGPCLAASRTSTEWIDIHRWRETFKQYLSDAETISAPSRAAAIRARRLVDTDSVVVHPHPQPLLGHLQPMPRPRRNDGVRKILIIGAIGPHKGAHLLYAMIQDAAYRDLPIQFELLGYTSDKRIVTGPHVTVHGPYNGDDDAAKRVHRIQPDLMFASSVVPETFSFIISVAMSLHLPLAAFDLGAPADRIGEYRRGVVLLRRLIDNPAGVNDALLAVDVNQLWDTPAQTTMEGVSALSEYFRNKEVTQAPPHVARSQSVKKRPVPEFVRGDEEPDGDGHTAEAENLATPIMRAGS